MHNMDCGIFWYWSSFDWTLSWFWASFDLSLSGSGNTEARLITITEIKTEKPLKET